MPELKCKVDSWDSITKLVPGFTKEMLLVAELMYRTDPFVVDKLNENLEEKNLAKVDHVLHAIYRLGDKYKTKEEKEETNFAIKKCIMDVSGSDETVAVAIRDQWPKCWKWTKSRVTFAHPLLQAKLADLQELKCEIAVNKQYDEVREAATFMVDLVTRLRTMECSLE